MTHTIPLDDAKASPSSVYAEPADVVADARLTAEQKLAILESWKLDEQRLQSSTDENMHGGEPTRIVAVAEALNAVKAGMPQPAPGSSGSRNQPSDA